MLMVSSILATRHSPYPNSPVFRSDSTTTRNRFRFESSGTTADRDVNLDRLDLSPAIKARRGDRLRSAAVGGMAWSSEPSVRDHDLDRVARPVVR